MEYACRCHANQGHGQRASEWSQRLIGHAPDRAAYRFLDALLCQERGDDRRAAARFREAIYLEPEFLLAHFALGNLARGAGRADESQRHFRNVLDLLGPMDDESLVDHCEGMTAGRLKELVGAVQRRR
jgi:chemotaxis protein methyltransferase CheR